MFIFFCTMAIIQFEDVNYSASLSFGDDLIG